MSYFPLFLNIGNIKFLVIGAGNIALAKLETLIEFGVDAKIVSKDSITQIDDLVKEYKIPYIQDSYDKKYLEGVDIVISATNDDKINAKIAKEAKELGILVNIVDDPQNCDFIFGANVKKENITISASTSGMSPVLARVLKQKINFALPQNLDLFNDFVLKNRQKVRDQLTNLQARRIFWQDALQGLIGAQIEVGNIENAQKLFNQKLLETKNKKQAAVYFIGAGPGDPELITLKAINALSRADVVLYDRLVADDILDYARKDAIKINVGKKKDFHRYKQNEINKLIADYAKKGNIVARLKGGDSTIFSRVGEEIDEIKDLDVFYQIIPGITAATGAAAYCGIPLTSRDSNKSVKFLTIYEKDLACDGNYWQNLAQSNDSLVLYMSSNNLNIICQNLVKAGKDGKTPIAVIEQATTKYQQTYISSISDFEKDLGKKEFVSPSVAIIGDIVNYHHEYKWLEEGSEGKYFKGLKARVKCGE